VYNWTEKECNDLTVGLTSEETLSKFKNSMELLKTRPVLYRYSKILLDAHHADLLASSSSVVDHMIVNRSRDILSAFQKALSESIDKFAQTDSMQYVGSLLSWCHQTCAEEWEFAVRYMDSPVKIVDKSMTVIRPLLEKRMQAFFYDPIGAAAGISSAQAFRLANLMYFYRNMITKILSDDVKDETSFSSLIKG